MKVLFTPYGGGSIAHIARSLAIADELKARGHDVMFTSTTGKKAFIENAGFPVFGNGHPEVNLNDPEDQTIGYFKKNQALFLEWLGDEIKAAEHFRPDIIVNSPTFFGSLASIKLGIPHVTVINAQWLTEFKGLLGLSLSQSYPHHAALRAVGRPVFARQFEKIYMAEIREFYRLLDIPAAPSFRKHLHENNPAIIPGIPEFEPIGRTPRTNIHYVGPLQWEGFEREPFDPSSMFERYGDRPFVYVFLGGSVFRQETYDSLIRAFSAHSEWNVLLGLGPNFKREAFQKDLPHLAIRTYTPGMAVCREADVVVSTGGHGAVMQALWHGKPVVALPHNIDQATIAARLVELGLGRNLNKVALKDFSKREEYFRKALGVTPENIVETVKQTLSDSIMQNRARTFMKHLHAYENPAGRAADLIETYGGRHV